MGMVSPLPALEALCAGTNPAPKFTGAAAALAQAEGLDQSGSALADIFAVMSPAAFADDQEPDQLWAFSDAITALKLIRRQPWPRSSGKLLRAATAR